MRGIDGAVPPRAYCSRGWLRAARATPEALVVTGDRRLAADLEGICELAEPAELPTPS
jgi:hypothetical protein